MKLIYFALDLDKTGGTQSFVKGVYEELKKNNYIKLINWKYDINIFNRILLRYSPNIISLYLFNNFFYKYFYKRYSRKNVLENIDLIHFWNPDPAITFLNSKFIVTCHGLDVLPTTLKGFRKNYYKNIFKFALKIHVNSHFTKKLITKYYKINSKKVVVIPPSVNYTELSKIKLIKNKDNKIIIGTLTRFVKRKNLLNIIKALNVIKTNEDIDFIFYLAGQGPEKNHIINTLNKYKINYKYFGLISEYEKIHCFYPSIDIFVLPTLPLKNDVEGFGIVYIEANSYGIPVVASNNGGVGEAVRDAYSGLFADPLNPNDIAKKIYKLLKNKKKYSKNAKKWAALFDSKKISKKLENLYKNILFIK